MKKANEIFVPWWPAVAYTYIAIKLERKGLLEYSKEREAISLSLLTHLEVSPPTTLAGMLALETYLSELLTELQNEIQ